MKVNEMYLAKIREAVEAHQEVHCAAHMLRIIDEAVVKEMTIDNLNASLLKALDDKDKFFPRVKQSFSKKSKEKAQNQKSELRIALLLAMRQIILSQPPKTPRSEDSLPMTPGTFGREIHFAHLVHWKPDEDPDIERKTNNSIERVDEVYARHRTALNNKQLPAHIKAFHKRRVEIILNWIEQGNINGLIETIKTMNSEVRRATFNLASDLSDSPIEIKRKQKILHWLGVILEEPQSSDKPYAMSEILDLVRLPDAQFKTAIEEFSKTYVELEAPVLINISSDLRKEFLNKLADKNIKELKQCLDRIYSDLQDQILGAHEINIEMKKLEEEENLNHPCNSLRAREKSASSKESSSLKESRSSRDLSSMGSTFFSSSSRRSSRIISATPSPVPTAATPDENSESSKSRSAPLQ